MIPLFDTLLKQEVSMDVCNAYDYDERTFLQELSLRDFNWLHFLTKGIKDWSSTPHPLRSKLSSREQWSVISANTKEVTLVQ
jgi:hypothetical protein